MSAICSVCGDELYIGGKCPGCTITALEKENVQLKAEAVETRYTIFKSLSTFADESRAEHDARQLAMQALANALREYVEMDDPKGADWTPTHAYEPARAALDAARPFLGEK